MQCKPDRFSHTGFEGDIAQVLQSIATDGPACRCALEERLELTHGAITQALLELYERGQVTLGVAVQASGHPVWAAKEGSWDGPNLTEHMYRKHVKG